MRKVSASSRKIKRYVLRGLMIVFGVLIISLIGTYIYVSVNKSKIIKSVTESLSEKINGTISVKDVDISFFRDFPTISVLLTDVRVTDSMISIHGHPFFQAKEVFARLSVSQLIKKKSPVKSVKLVTGAVYLFTDSSGYSNGYLIKGKGNSKSKSEASEDNFLSKVELKNFRVTLEDKRREKLHDIDAHNLILAISAGANETKLQIKTSMLVHALGFNLARGIYLKEQEVTGDFALLLDHSPKQLRFDEISLKVADQRINLTGRFDLEGSSPQFQLNISTENIVYTKLKSLLPDRISRSLSMVDLKNPISGQTRLNGPLKGGEPMVTINWQAKETRITTPFLDFDEASFTGSFTNEVTPGRPRNDSNSRILVNNFNASWRNLPIQARNIQILNLMNPVLTCDLNSKFPLTRLNELIGAGSVEFRDGDAEVNISYAGPVQRDSTTNSYLNGTILFTDGKLNYTPRNVEMKAVSATLRFKNSDVFIENFKSSVLNNNIVMNGFAKNLLTLINTSPNNVNLEWNIYSPAINLNSFVYLLDKRKKVASKQKSKFAISNMADKIDQLLDQGKVQVTLKADKITYKKFDGSQVQANVSILNDQYLINQVAMRHAGGGMNLSGSLLSSQNSNDVKLNLTLKDVDVHQLFKSFDNFGQDGITAESLEGKLSADVVAGLRLSPTGAVIPSSVVSTINFSLKNGALINYEPVKKMQRSIFKKRDFENIRFAELKDKLEVKDREIKINRMEIQSSVLTMFVEGLYSQKGNTDLSIQVPINNLKKRDSSFIPTNLGTDKKGGRSIFIRGRPDTDGTIKFSLDLLNKYQKAKKIK